VQIQELPQLLGHFGSLEVGRNDDIRQPTQSGHSARRFAYRDFTIVSPGTQRSRTSPHCYDHRAIFEGLDQSL
jgi:hypothetical protein